MSYPKKSHNKAIMLASKLAGHLFRCLVCGGKECHKQSTTKLPHMAALASRINMKTAILISLILAASISQAGNGRWLSLVVNQSLDGTVWFLLESQGDGCFLTIKIMNLPNATELSALKNMEVTKMQCKTTFELHDRISYEEIDGLSRRMSSDGSMWKVSSYANLKEKQETWAYNPGAEYQLPEGGKLYEFGEYLWKLGALDSPLY